MGDVADILGFKGAQAPSEAEKVFGAAKKGPGPGGGGKHAKKKVPGMKREVAGLIGKSSCC